MFVHYLAGASQAMPASDIFNEGTPQNGEYLNEIWEKTNSMVHEYVDGANAYFSYGYNDQFCPKEECKTQKDSTKPFNI